MALPEARGGVRRAVALERDRPAREVERAVRRVHDDLHDGRRGKLLRGADRRARGRHLEAVVRVEAQLVRHGVRIDLRLSLYFVI